jgi:hypothetical protein
LKIAISTLVGYFNYGNRLQNYALQEVLKNLGNDVVTIKDYTDIQQHRSLRERIVTSVKNGNFVKKLFSKMDINAKKKNKKMDLEREQVFKKFTNEHIKESDFFIDQDTKDFSFDDEFDCYVIGSDQVWNYSFPTFSELNFVSYSSKPKISYAASFGVSEIPNSYRNLYQKGLNELSYISVREDAGKDIVKSIIHKDVDVVLDPTLLLGKDKWDKLIKDSEVYKKKYILTYFLEEMNEDDEKYIYEFAKSKKLEIKRLYYRKDIDNWSAGPKEFVNLISQCEMLFTDSFHGSVFAIIFEKQFEVFSRNGYGPSMNSRIDTLLNDFNISDRWHSSNSEEEKIDYHEVKMILQNKREKSFNYLKEALNSVERNIK